MFESFKFSRDGVCRVMTSIPAVFRMNVEHYIIGPANFSLIGFALDRPTIPTCLRSVWLYWGLSL
jgi:hypothetical protein